MQSQPNSFASLASLLLPTPARLFATACCPDKDLVALVVSTKNNSNKDKLSLWKLQGSKVWEVDVTPIDASSKIVGLAWSPNG
jgi:anaphase-promoting complex subunit 4